jgi:DNA-binding protein H-NS
MELHSMPLKELKQLKKNVEKAITSFEERRVSEAREKLEAQAKEMGFSLSELVGTPKAKTISPPKYRHPENAENTWTGRGRKPGWIVEALARGEDIENFAI